MEQNKIYILVGTFDLHCIALQLLSHFLKKKCKN